MTKSKDTRRHNNGGQVKELRKEIEGMVRQRTKELSVLRDTVSAINWSLPLNQMLEAATEAVLETVPSAQGVVIHLCGEAASILVPIASAQRDDHSRKRAPPSKIIETIAHRAAKKQRQIYIPDLRKEARVLDGTVAPIHKKKLSLLIVPVISDQKIVGTLSVYGAEVEAFTDHDQCLAEIFAGWAAIAIKKTQLRFEAKQSQEAALTALANQTASA